MPPALIGPRPRKPPTPPPRRGLAAREEMLHDIRLRLQGEVINAFDTLLDAPADRHPQPKIEGIVDRVIDRATTSRSPATSACASSTS